MKWIVYWNAGLSFSLVSYFYSSSCFIPFYNLALKKIKRKYEHWCKIEALFIFCTDQISIQFSLSHEWFLQMNMTYFLATIDICARNNKQYVDLYGILWFKWTNTFILKIEEIVCFNLIFMQFSKMGYFFSSWMHLPYMLSCNFVKIRIEQWRGNLNLELLHIVD